jgi:hypothetical protein
MTICSERLRGVDDADGLDEFFVRPVEKFFGEEVEARYDDTGPRLALLRCLLQASQGRLNAHEAAYKLGCSTRTLQRTLRLTGTTFQAEVQAARLAAVSLVFDAGHGGLPRHGESANARTPRRRAAARTKR